MNSKSAFDNRNEPYTPPINIRERAKETDYKSEFHIKNTSINHENPSELNIKNTSVTQDDKVIFSKLEQYNTHKNDQKEHPKATSISIPLTKNKQHKDKSLALRINPGIPDERSFNDKHTTKGEASHEKHPSIQMLQESCNINNESLCDREFLTARQTSSLDKSYSKRSIDSNSRDRKNFISIKDDINKGSKASFGMPTVNERNRINFESFRPDFDNSKFQTKRGSSKQSSESININGTVVRIKDLEYNGNNLYESPIFNEYIDIDNATENKNETYFEKNQKKHSSQTSNKLPNHILPNFISHKFHPSQNYSKNSCLSSILIDQNQTDFGSGFNMKQNSPEDQNLISNTALTKHNSNNQNKLNLLLAGNKLENNLSKKNLTEVYNNNAYNLQNYRADSYQKSTIDKNAVMNKKNIKMKDIDNLKSKLKTLKTSQKKKYNSKTSTNDFLHTVSNFKATFTKKNLMLDKKRFSDAHHLMMPKSKKNNNKSAIQKPESYASKIMKYNNIDSEHATKSFNRSVPKINVTDYIKNKTPDVITPRNRYKASSIHAHHSKHNVSNNVLNTLKSYGSPSSAKKSKFDNSASQFQKSREYKKSREHKLTKQNTLKATSLQKTNTINPNVTPQKNKFSTAQKFFERDNSIKYIDTAQGSDLNSRYNETNISNSNNKNSLCQKSITFNMKSKKIDLEVTRDSRSNSKADFGKSLHKEHTSKITLPANSMQSNKANGILDQMHKITNSYLMERSYSNIRQTTAQKNSIANEVRLNTKSTHHIDPFTTNLVPSENKRNKSYSQIEKASSNAQTYKKMDLINPINSYQNQELSDDIRLINSKILAENTNKLKQITTEEEKKRLYEKKLNHERLEESPNRFTKLSKNDQKNLKVNTSVNNNSENFQNITTYNSMSPRSQSNNEFFDQKKNYGSEQCILKDNYKSTDLHMNNKFISSKDLQGNHILIHKNENQLTKNSDRSQLQIDNQKTNFESEITPNSKLDNLNKYTIETEEDCHTIVNTRNKFKHTKNSDSWVTSSKSITKTLKNLDMHTSNLKKDGMSKDEMKEIIVLHKSLKEKIKYLEEKIDKF